MEPGEPIDNPGGSVGPDTDGTSVGGDGKDVGGAPQGRNGNPAGVGTERDVLEEDKNKIMYSSVPLYSTKNKHYRAQFL